MKGHITQRGKDPLTWSLVVDIGRDPVTGKRRQKWVTLHGNKREAQAALNNLLSDLQKGAYVAPQKLTVSEYLDNWLRDYVEPNLKQTTIDHYRQMVERHIRPGLGALRLDRVAPAHIQAVYSDSLEHGSETGGPLAPKTVHHIHTVLRRALNQAVRWGLIAANPIERVDPPRVTRPPVVVWDPAQVEAFLAHVKSDRLFAAFWLALTAGMRRGEILGLQWSDIDWELQRIGIRRALVPTSEGKQLLGPKTPGSVRTVDVGPATLEVLRQHQLAQREESEALGLGVPTFVFTRPEGGQLDPTGLARRFKRLAAAAGLPRIRFHDLRHTSATLLLRQGTHPKVVSERLGHSSVRITLDTYSHVVAGLQHEAAVKLEDSLTNSQDEGLQNVSKRHSNATMRLV